MGSGGVLDERARKARAARLAREADVRARVLVALSECLPAGERAWLIGSLAWGGFGVRSDVDVVLEHRLASDVALALERKIALIADAEVELLELDALPAGFRERILREGIEVYGR